MKIRLRTILAGPNLRGQPGEILDLAPDAARSLLVGGYAELAEEPAGLEAGAPAETAAREPPEAATTRRRRPRGR